MIGKRLSGSALAPELVERVLERLGMSESPALDPDGLSELLGAWCGAIPFGNARKRIAIANNEPGPLPGTEADDFFKAWLRYGTGGTCWPLNGAFWGLAAAVGFEARRHAGTILTGELEAHGLDVPNHGSVLVALDGIDYLADPNIGSFTALPLTAGRASSTGEGIHDIRAVPRENTFDIVFRAGTRRDEELTFRMQPGLDPVDEGFFRERYEVSRDSTQSPFNAALYVTRRFPDRIVTVGRMNMLVVNEADELTTRGLDEEKRRRVLIEELGFSEEIVAAIPPDEEEENPFFQPGEMRASRPSALGRRRVAAADRKSTGSGPRVEPGR